MGKKAKVEPKPKPKPEIKKKTTVPKVSENEKKPDDLQKKVPIYYTTFIEGLRGMDVKELRKLGKDLQRDLPEEVMVTLAPGSDFKTYSAVKGTNVVRRICHALASLACVYYFFGPTIFGVPKEILIFIALSIIPLFLDTCRLKLQIKAFGIRDHERDKFASYVWFTHGSLLLILLTPQQIAAPIIIAASFGDPIIGEIRRFRRSIAFGVGILFCCLVFILFQYHWIMAIVAGTICFLAEATEFGYRWSLRRDLFYSRHQGRESELVKYSRFYTTTDDDFTMQVLPGLILLIIYLMNPGWFPEPLIEPIGFLAGLG